MNSSVTLPAHSLGTLAIQIPGTSVVLRRIKLDFCCGDQQSLEQASLDKHLNVSFVAGEIITLQLSHDKPVAATPSELIEHILLENISLFPVFENLAQH